MGVFEIGDQDPKTVGVFFVSQNPEGGGGHPQPKRIPRNRMSDSPGLLNFYRAKEGYLQGQIGNPEGEAGPRRRRRKTRGATARLR